MSNNPDVQLAMFHEMQKKKVNHILHLILSFGTAGLWLPVWIGVTSSVNKHNANIGKPPAKSYTLHVLALVVIALAVVLMP